MQGAIGLAGVLLISQLCAAKPEYTRKTKLECETCHPPNARTLNEGGEYYRTHHYKMDGYSPKDKVPGEKPKEDTVKSAKGKPAKP